MQSLLFVQEKKELQQKTNTYSYLFLGLFWNKQGFLPYRICSLFLQVFGGNCDHFTPVLNFLQRGVTARYIRFYPVTYNYVCMRVEVYGCDAWLHNVLPTEIALSPRWHYTFFKSTTIYE